MHTISISLQGAANDSVAIEVADSDALPIYVKLKEVIASNDGRIRGRRRRGPADAKTQDSDESAPAPPEPA